MIRRMIALVVIGAVVFMPSFSPLTRQEWVSRASWYGGDERLHRRTAMGQRFDPEAFEAAMWGVPLGSLVQVTNQENGRSVVVRVTDRGPARRFGNRVIDLTRRSFAELAPLRSGLISVRVQRFPLP